MTKEEFSKLIGNNIRTRRRELDMTQDELGIKVGYTNRHSISKAELGEVDIPISKIFAISQALNCSIAYLFSINEISDKATKGNLSSELGYRDATLLESFDKLSNLNKNVILHLIDELAE